MKALRKILLTGIGIWLSFGSLSAHADSPAVECLTLPGRLRVEVRIDNGFGSSWQDATVVAYRIDGSSVYSNHSVMADSFGLWEIRYWGNDFDLRIDTFLDSPIHYYTFYSADLDTGITGEVSLRCQFLPF